MANDSPNRPGGGRQIFRQASLERLASPEHVDELMRVTLPRSWIALTTLGMLVLGAVAWGVFGRLPVTVSARGVLVPRARLASIPELDAAVPASPGLVSVHCFDVRDGGRVERGMSVGVSPDTAPRERYGDLVGEIATITKAPVFSSELAKVVDGAERAAQLVPPEGCMLAVASLAPEANNVSGYRWSSSRGPDHRMLAGIATGARVLVERRAPISYVVPLLRTAD